MTTLAKIESPRLIVDDFTENDFPFLMDIFAAMKKVGQSWYNVDADKPATVQNFLDQALDNKNAAQRETFRMAVRKKPDNGQHHEANELIGYVSLCEIFKHGNGLPDTGILITPDYQRGRYGREARLGLMMMAFSMGLEAIYCDIELQNHASQSNVRGMGYQQLTHADGSPRTYSIQTLEGTKSVYRFGLKHDDFWNTIPGLVSDHVTKCGWDPRLSNDFNAAVQGAQTTRPKAITMDIAKAFGPFSVSVHDSAPTHAP